MPSSNCLSDCLSSVINFLWKLTLFYENVDFYLEQTLYESKFVNFHPLINTLTITIETKRFIEFMIENDKKIHIFSSVEGKVLKTYGK